MNGTSVSDPMKDILGKGLIVHQGTDDFTSQPSGNAC
jgi:Cu-Zn family superoxide dismutase